MEYTLTKTEGGFTIKNGTNHNMSIGIYIKTCGSNKRRVLSRTIKSKETIEACLGFLDGDYLVTMLTPSEEITIPFHYNKNTMKVVIDGMEDVCNICNCKDCGDCEDKGVCKSDKFLVTLNTVLAYYFLNIDKYSQLSEFIFSKLECEIRESLTCMINLKSMVNKSDFTELAEKLIVVFYSIFLVEELLGDITEEEVSVIKEKYKVDRFQTCLLKYNIRLEDIIKEITDNTLVYYWNQGNYSLDIQELSESLSMSYLDSKPKESLSVFQDGFVVPVTSISKIAFVVRRSANDSFQILDALGNNVTETFDTFYNPTLQAAIFISKNVYAPSNIFFKFKKLIFNE